MFNRAPGLRRARSVGLGHRAEHAQALHLAEYSNRDCRRRPRQCHDDSSEFRTLSVRPAARTAEGRRLKEPLNDGACQLLT